MRTPFLDEDFFFLGGGGCQLKMLVPPYKNSRPPPPQCHPTGKILATPLLFNTGYLLIHETLNSINHYEYIYENSENLSKVTPVYST